MFISGKQQGELYFDAGEAKMYDTNIGLDWGGTNSKIKKERLLKS